MNAKQKKHIEAYNEDKAPDDFNAKDWLRRRIYKKHQQAKGWAKMNGRQFPGSLEMLLWWRREEDKLRRALKWIDGQP